LIGSPALAEAGSADTFDDATPTMHVVGVESLR
jgi:hypothetical protein